LDASLDAKEFAEAKFPPNFQVDHQTAYTVLDSSTHTFFLHVTVNGRVDQEYGSIIKSNSRRGHAAGVPLSCLPLASRPATD
jgi:hypothetical protein